MVRTMDPAIVKTSFWNQLSDVFGFYQRTSLLVAAQDANILARSTLMASATLWESFISDLFVAYINRDPSRFAEHMQSALAATLSPKQAVIQQNFAKFTPPSSIPKKLILKIIDHNGSNLTFEGAKSLADGAKRYLNAQDRLPFMNLTGQQKACLNLWLAARNHIAHDSDKSRIALKDAVTDGRLNGTGLQRNQNQIINTGAYLRAASAPGGVTRLEVLINEMLLISTVL